MGPSTATKLNLAAMTYTAVQSSSHLMHGLPIPSTEPRSHVHTLGPSKVKKVSTWHFSILWWKVHSVSHHIHKMGSSQSIGRQITWWTAKMNDKCQLWLKSCVDICTLRSPNSAARVSKEILMHAQDRNKDFFWNSVYNNKNVKRTQRLLELDQ